MVLRLGVRGVFIGCVLATLLPAQQDRLGGAIDGRRSVVIRGSVPARAQRQFDRGAVEPSFRMSNVTLMLKPSPAQQAELDRLLVELQDPQSPNYHQWLTPETYAERFGASSGDLERIANWLRGAGFTLEYTARGRDFISFSGTAGQVEGALHTEIHRYQVGNEAHFANANDLSLPADIEPMVAGVMGLHNFRLNAPRKRVVAQFTPGDGNNYLAPDDLATIYNLMPMYGYGYDGTGQKIVIVGQSDIDPDDIAAFRNVWGLPPTQIQMIPTGTYPGFNGDETEADLDLEWAGAMARNASLTYVYSDDVSYATYYAIDNNIAPLISFSYGLCEFQVGINRMGLYYFQIEAQKANAQGITWLASSGDSGAAGCDASATVATQGLAVSIPASVPEITAVGGTQFDEGSGAYWSGSNGPDGGTALSYIPERAWNETSLSESFGGGLAASGGGVSAYYKKPSWQSGPGVPNDGARDLPDMSLTAASGHDPYVVISQGQAIGVGGTSASSPSFAGMLAVLSQYLVQNQVQSKPGLGNINPKLYGLAGTSGVFHDITAGDNIVPCQTGTADCDKGTFGYKAGAGYDMVTGLGSVDAYKLITAWSGIQLSSTSMTLTASPATITTSGFTTLTATVTAAGGTHSPTGSVSFTAGETLLGTGTLAGSGTTATASIRVFGGNLLAATTSVQATYAGSPIFGPSAATGSITLGTPAKTSNVVVSVTPNPVYQQPPDANGATFSFTVKLAETAGVQTTVTGFSFAGINYSGSIGKFFGSTTLAANGSLSAALKGSNIAVPSTVPMVFTGRDDSGTTWTRQATVQFLPAQ
jgi:subtilase family serine protease